MRHYSHMRITDTIYRNVRAAVVLLERESAAAFAPFDLTLAQFGALDVTSQNAGLRMGELADRLLIDDSTTTRIVTSLVDRGLVERTRDPIDGRAFVLTVTAAGDKLRTEAAQAHSAMLADRLSVLAKEDQSSLESALRTLINSLYPERTSA